MRYEVLRTLMDPLHYHDWVTYGPGAETQASQTLMSRLFQQPSELLQAGFSSAPTGCPGPSSSMSSIMQKNDM